MIWAAVLGGSLLAYAMKLLGFALPAELLDRPRVRRIAGYLPIAMLAALVAVQTVATGTSVSVDARLAGLAAAVVALLLRAPFLVVVLVAAATAATLRAVGLLP
jgi:branched-subunit amino acid transport protein